MLCALFLKLISGGTVLVPWENEANISHSATFAFSRMALLPCCHECVYIL